MDSNEIIPEMWYDQVPGISLINGSRLPYGTWHLLNEALSCYRNSEHFACISCLVGSIEIWLKRTLNSKKKIVDLIEEAKKSEIMTTDEAEYLQEIRKVRNMYIHFDLKKLPKIKRAIERELGQKSAYEVEPYPTQDHKDAVPLMLLTVRSYFSLNYIIEFFYKRYPNDSGLIATYYRCKLTEIKTSPKAEKRLMLGIDGTEKSRF